MNIEQLKQYCSDSIGRHLNDPFPVKVDGEEWTVATDGMILFSVRGAVEGTPPVNIKLSPSTIVAAGSFVKETITATNSVDIDLTALLAFCGPYEAAKETECSECDGTGSICSCGECECEHCEGGTVFDYPKKRWGFVHGVVCDLNRLAKLLAGRSGTAKIVAHAGTLDPISFMGGDWCALLMPVRTPKDDEASAYPSFGAAK